MKYFAAFALLVLAACAPNITGVLNERTCAFGSLTATDTGATFIADETFAQAWLSAVGNIESCENCIEADNGVYAYAENAQMVDLILTGSDITYTVFATNTEGETTFCAP